MAGTPTIRHFCDIFFIVLLLTQHMASMTALRTLGDSILEIINTKEVERMIAQREENDSKDEKLYLAQNELDDNYEMVPEIDRHEVLYQQQNSNVLAPGKPIGSSNPRVNVDMLLKQNHTDPYRNTEFLNELRGLNGRKVLKSSKNALLVTRKEYLKRDWCKTEPLIQKIKEEGCLTRTIINRFCYGQCNSFYIPKNPKRRVLKNGRKSYDDEDETTDLNGAAFKSCAFCKPDKFTWITVTLKCPSRQPQLRRKRIQRIKLCKCTAKVSN